MFKNFIKTAIRNITSSKFYSLLNILGLSIGLIAFVFIFIYIRDELSYDKHHAKHERIHRLESQFTISNKADQWAIVPIPMAPALQLEYPEVESYVRFQNTGNTLYRHGEKEYYEEDFYYTDSTVFQVFTHHMLMGNPDKALTEPNAIVLTQSTAKKYFGGENPMGNIITNADNRQYKVTGVIEDLPGNTHLKYDGLISAMTLAAEHGEEEFNSMEPVRFWNIGVYSYVLLKENAGMQSIHDKFQGFYDKYMKSIGDQINASFTLMSSPLADTHFSGNLSSDRPTGNKTYVYIFSAVALFILLLAAINYMNMATARSLKRSKEVGIRKVSGAYRGQLIGQFLSESVILTVISFIIALGVVYLLMPDFNNLSGKEIPEAILTNPVLLIQLFLIAVIIGLVAGSYPAFYLSSFNPAKVLKGTTSGGRAGGRLRRVLVVFQFWVATMMVIGTLIVSNQLDYLQSKDLGFDKKNQVVLELQDSAFRAKQATLIDELKQSSYIENATNTTGVPGRTNWTQVVRVEKEGKMIDDLMVMCFVDYNFQDVYDLELAQGRYFDKSMGTDQQEAVIINETAAKMYGWHDEALGKKIHHGFGEDMDGGRILKVIGVVKDYHFKSLHNKMQPLMIALSEYPNYLVTAKVKDGKIPQALDYIETKWNSFGAKRPFDYRILEESLHEMYDGEQKIAVIFRVAAGISLIIALIGLLGLSSFVAEQKTKEIGIRKVVGASVQNVLQLLYKEFALLIVIGLTLAVPLAWWGMGSWLERNFIYHIDIHWLNFLIAGFVALIIGLLAISYHTIKAATGNMVDAIKYE
ncbi:MAG: ABC transporter permease [Bacteroidales bacterium]|nr:ABC transporter permease [Bacteroidales bacterium]